MKNKINNITKLGMALGLTAIMALTPGQANAHPGGGGGGGHNGGGGGKFYATVSTVHQLISDINYANTAGGAFTINVAAGTTFDLTGQTGPLPDIGAGVDLTILGNGDTLAANDNYRLFTVLSGSSLTVEDLTLNNGFTQLGGAIYNAGTLTTGNCTLTNNSAGWGACIYNASGGAATINDSTISGNYAVSDGAGIYNDGGILTINSSVLSSNTAEFGGAICINGGTVAVNDSILFGNTAYYFSYELNRGGAGGGIYSPAGTVTISGSILTSNRADISGGGLCIGAGGTVTVENSTITNNTVNDVDNESVLYLDSSSTIGTLVGNDPIGL